MTAVTSDGIAKPKPDPKAAVVSRAALDQIFSDEEKRSTAVKREEDRLTAEEQKAVAADGKRREKDMQKKGIDTAN
jgi:hypothetical protein